MTSPYSPQARLSDADRTDALNQLAQAVGEGRITVAEFEERSDDVVRARTRGELMPVLNDIPVVRRAEIKAYSQGDIDRARRAARKPKLATALVGTLGLTFTALACGVAGTGAGAGLGIAASLLLIPTLWILLYVAKVGPASWHMPSARQVERQAAREVRALTAVQRAQQKELESQMWAQRRQQAGDIAGEAMNLAKRKFTEWNGR